MKAEISFALTKKDFFKLHLSVCSQPKTSMTYFATITEESSRLLLLEVSKLAVNATYSFVCKYLLKTAVISMKLKVSSLFLFLFFNLDN